MLLDIPHLPAAAVRPQSRAGRAETNGDAGPCCGGNTFVAPTDSPRLLMELVCLGRSARRAAGEGDDGPRRAVPQAARDLLVTALGHRDPATLAHGLRCAHLASQAGRSLGVAGDELQVLESAALLHDVGKIGVPDNVLHKPGALCAEEAELMALHHGVGLTVLQACGAKPDVLNVIRLAGPDADDLDLPDDASVSLAARIVKQVDVYDSLTTPQSFRDAVPAREALALMRDRAEHRYDETIVGTLERVAAASHDLVGPGGTLRLGRRGLDPAVLRAANGTGADATAESLLRAVQLCHIFGYLYLLETLYEGICLLDGDLRCTVWSPGLEPLLGRDCGSMLGEARSGRTFRYADEGGRPLAEGDRPLDRVLTTGRAHVQTVRVEVAAPGDDAGWAEVELQTFPLLDAAGGVCGVAEIYRNLGASTRNRREVRELRRAASRDALTGLANRGELDARLAGAMRHRDAAGSDDAGDAPPLSLVFLDIDHFKPVNDTHGHAAGDLVLKKLARVLREQSDHGMTVGRYGGEEFVLICPDAGLEDTAERAERLRRHIAGLVITGDGLDEPGLRITSSFGVAAAGPGDTADSLMRRADGALYHAKETGRNRVVTFTPEQFAAGGGRPDEPVAEDYDGTEVLTCQGSASMIGLKLKGFVEDAGARWVSLGDDTVSFRLGNRGLTGRWGRRADDRPVEVRVRVEPPPRGRRPGAVATCTLHVRVVPLGWGVTPDKFRDRGRRVVRELRSYLVTS